jgi:predicted NBD/HSP70 family sugar kinase
MTPGIGHKSANRTRSVILDQIRASGKISRVELAASVGFTEATISNAVRRLITDGIVLETGFSESTGGKRRILLDINRSSRHALGVSLDRAVITLVVTNLAGELVGSTEVEGTADEDPESVVRRIAVVGDELIRSLSIDPTSVVGIGVASPGPLDTATGVLRGRQPDPVWRGFPLEQRLEAVSGMPVVLDNDATCAALGEYWTRREGPTPSVSATVYMSDGIGCGILIDGRIFHGTSSNAGEMGHITINIDGPLCQCGARGCVEVYASPAAVMARALEDPALVAQLGLVVDETVGRANFDRIAEAAMNGHEASRAIIAGAAGYLGRGIVTLSNILDLDEVHLSGPGFAGAGPIYVGVVQQYLDSGTFMRGIHPVKVTISNIGTEAAALGAAALILQQEITPHSAVGLRRRQNANS